MLWTILPELFIESFWTVTNEATVGEGGMPIFSWDTEIKNNKKNKKNKVTFFINKVIMLSGCKLGFFKKK